MDSNIVDKDSLDGERQEDNPTLRDGEGQPRLQQFDPSRQKLLAILELSRSFHAVFQGDTSIARYFKVPLMSDTVAERVAWLFNEPHPQVIESENDDCGDNITWIDIIRDHTCEPKLQSDGSYYCRLEKRGVLVKISEYDRNLIFSDDLRNLVHIKSHGSDVQAEKDTMTAVVDMNNSILGTLDAKLDALEKTDKASCSAQAGSNYACNSNVTDLQDHLTHKASARGQGAMVRKRGRKSGRLPRNPTWTDGELDKLPSWFEPRRHRSQDEIERDFLRDFHCYRSFSAIQTKYYDQKKKNKKGVGHRNKRKTIRLLVLKNLLARLLLEALKSYTHWAERLLNLSSHGQGILT
ncbi:hypothetical protein N7474_010112 [Penicillium riverlandense]|uniref:uncharacterized protein n=1 Tax=Penicillium riverlandense TaxID=1903569 RepID=UPI002547B077|nr:uncharacterized protein N7474_010112 [Penicillium riverlandense]KAJ5808843.1 hypothetical protein N7474_010112 [Penicillium riverlandense]